MKKQSLPPLTPLKKSFFTVTKKSVTLVVLALLILAGIIFFLFNKAESILPLAGVANDAAFFQVPFSVSEGLLSGVSLLNFSNQTTPALDVGKYTEYSLWLNCSGFSKFGNITNISTIRYQISPDSIIWVNGSTFLCANNFTKVDLTDKSFRYIRLDLKGNQEFGTNVNNSFRFVLSAK